MSPLAAWRRLKPPAYRATGSSTTLNSLQFGDPVASVKAE
jgi:hypothetical protein